MKQRNRIAWAATCLGALLLAGCAASHRPREPLRADTSAFPDLTSVRGEPSNRGVVLFISADVFVDELELKTSARRDLAAVAGYLQQHPSQRLLIAGSAVSPSAATHNAELARRRGATIEAFFLRSGVDPRRLEVRTTRDHRPIGRNAAASTTTDGPGRWIPAPASARSSL